MTKLQNFVSIASTPVISGVPVAHYDSHLYNFENRYKDNKFFPVLVNIVDCILSADIKQSPRYIVLCGQPGSGKTHFMVGLYRALVHKLGFTQGSGAMFITFTYLAEEIISLFQQNIPLRTSLAGYEQARWLFLDDFTSSERVLKQDSLEFIMLRDVLIDRYEQCSTLITSCNMSSADFLGEIDRLFGEYVTSRLSEGRIIQFPSCDFRRVK